MIRTGLIILYNVAYVWWFVCLCGNSSDAMTICWDIGGICECSWLFMIMITLVARLSTMVVTCFLIACSCYKKVLLVCWNSSLVERTHGFKLNEVELPHDVSGVITI